MSKEISNYKKYSNEILDDVECYKLVLNGSLKLFPKGFWTKPWSLQSAKSITIYLLEEKLKYTKKEIPKKVCSKLFRDNKLNGMLNIVFNNNVFKVLDNAYPGVYVQWQLKNISLNFWKKDENIKSAVQWVVKEKLGNSRDRVVKEFNTKLLLDNNLATLTQRKSLYELINIAYPGEYKEWELSFTPKKFWENKENIKAVVKWIVETKLDNDKERVYKEFNSELLKKLGYTKLSKMSKSELLELAYEGVYDSSKFYTPKGQWQDFEAVKSEVLRFVDTNLGGDINKLTADKLKKCKAYASLKTFKFNEIKQALKQESRR